MNIEIQLDEKQESALTKRVSEHETPEGVIGNIVREQINQWVDADYTATVAALSESLKNQPKKVLDSIIAQLSEIK